MDVKPIITIIGGAMRDPMYDDLKIAAIKVNIVILDIIYGLISANGKFMV